MKKVLLILICLFHINLYAEENKKVYFAGGCFWCMEESFDKVEGVISVVSGYSGGHLKNPTYADVVYTDSGHVEAVEITYDSKVISYEKLLNEYWENIDPFDAAGQFCDKGKSYRSVIFFNDKKQKDLIKTSFKKIEKMFDKKIVTLVWKFEKFYKAESVHQDYYEKNFVRYLVYKKGCQREETLKKIWN
jgi:peptide-methionine (S)-S-oxide reductase|tara:strand:- start:123 stop:692 length:570 start_codon:yes stop_codon:yes gene_type:complete